jgi:hypothetical protein
MILTLAGSALAFDLGSDRPAKPEVTYPQNVPSDMRQGGDTILDAVVVSLPVVDGAGTTVGYNNDYDEVCPFSGSTSPDVVYTFTTEANISIDIDLLGSDYDTKLYVYDADLDLVACNEDFHPDWTSKLENVAVIGFVPYYVVIDGYGGASGNYVINITEHEPCVVDCSVGYGLEGEPPLEDGYIDAHNSGCGSPEFGNPLGSISSGVFCGESGWYISADGANARDTDWFEVSMPGEGLLEIFADAEYATYLFELGPHDCGSVAVIQNVTFGPCTDGIMVITGAPGSTVWLWVGPTTFEGPVNQYDYLPLSNIPIGLATERHSWSGVKALFN